MSKTVTEELAEWVVSTRYEDVPEPGPTFVPLALPAPAIEGDIRIELQRAGTTVTLVWPASAAGDCAAWLREVLR